MFLAGRLSGLNLFPGFVVGISSKPHSSSSFSHPEKLEAGLKAGLDIGGGKFDKEVNELGAGAAYYYLGLRVIWLPSFYC